MEFKATGTWVALEDPREKKQESQIYIPDEVKQRELEDPNMIKTNILTIHSAGAGAVKQESRLQPGRQVVVDPRAGFLVTAIDEVKEEYLIVVPYNQLVMVQ